MNFGLGIGLGFNKPSGTGGGLFLPGNVIAPAVTPTSVSVGETLTATDGTWSGNPAPTFTYQWQRDGVNIAGETASTYVTQGADAGSDITVIVTGTNSQGNSSASSNVAIVAPNPPSGGFFSNRFFAPYYFTNRYFR